MSTVRRVAKNTLVWLFGDIGGKILSLLFVIYAARYLHAEGYGTLSFALAFTGMFGMLSDIGFYELMVREIARDKSAAGKYIGNVIMLKFFLVAAMLGLICIAINAMNYPALTVKLVYILGASIAIDAFSMTFHATFHAFERMEFISIGKILKNVILLTGAVVITYEGLGILAFAYLYLIGSLFLLAYSFTLVAIKFVKPRFELDKGFCKWLIKEGLPFWASVVFASVYYDIDKIMLSMMVGDVAVGWYSAAYKLVATLGFIPTASIASIYPVTSRLFISSKTSLKFATEKALKYMLMLGVPLGVMITLLSDKIILFIYGEDYVPSIVALQILIWSGVLLFVNSVLINLLNSINKQIMVTKIVASMAAFNVLANLLLIPRYSIIGASLATVMTRCLGSLLLFMWVMNSEYAIHRNISYTVLKVGVASVLIGIPIKYFGSIAIVPSIILYVCLIYGMRGIDETDVKLIKQIIAR